MGSEMCIRDSAVLVAPGPKPTYTKVKPAQPLSDILGQISKTHSREPVKPKGSRNVPVTTKQTIYVRANPAQAANTYKPPSHAYVVPLAVGNGPMAAGKGPPDSGSKERIHKQTDTHTLTKRLTSHTDQLTDRQQPLRLRLRH